MTPFAGVVSFDATLPPSLEDRLINALPGRSMRAAVFRRSPHALFAQDKKAPAAPPDITDRPGHVFAAAARIDNRDELASWLGIEPPLRATTSDRLLLMRAFEKAGDEGLAKVVGTFALAYWDESARRLVLARDCLGRAPLFFCRHEDSVAFATTLNGLLAIPGVPREIDEITLGHLLASNLHEPRRTIYRGIERVPSRTRITFERDGYRLHKYWASDLTRPAPYAKQEDYVARARELFDQAVAASFREAGHAALLLSGGLDSSAIAATWARLAPVERLTCYTGVPEGEVPDYGSRAYTNERDKVDALRLQYPALDVNFVVPPSISAVDKDPTALFVQRGMPIRNIANFGWFAGVEAAFGPDVTTVITGAHGNFGLTWDGLFSLVELLRKGRPATFGRELAAVARESGQSLTRTFAAEVALRMTPDNLYRAHHRFKGRDPDDVSRFSLLNRDFARDVDLAHEWPQHRYDPYYAIRGLSGAEFRAFHLFDANQIAREAGAMHYSVTGRQSRAPHLDRRLLEFCLAVPETMYRQNGVARTFARRVFADRLPPEILNERRRGMQSPAWFRTLTTRRAEIAREIERFEASPLARRVLDLSRMKQLLSAWPKDEHVAQDRMREYRYALARGVHMGQFIRWVEGGNA